MINVFCPWCDEFHYHSWNADYKRGETNHRVAHCGDAKGNPLKDSGYYVGEITPAKMKGTWK